jgi:N-acetylmuramoyl-L-alanine amidase
LPPNRALVKLSLRMKPVLAVVVAVLAAPAAAFAAGPTLNAQEVPLHGVATAGARTPAGAVPRFNMVGLHWRGSGTVSFRTRSVSSGWSAWQKADDDRHVEHSWHLGNLVWTGAANAIRFRIGGSVTGLRAYYVWSPSEPGPLRRTQIAGEPPIILRLSWGADESIRRAPPRYADAVHFAIVHHTAGSNNYTPAQSAAIVRGIQIYHVKGNGWDDIGYNFLVDKYGQIFEGRYGGMDRPVIGAHALGFNTGAVGVSVIGDYGSSRISAAAKASLEQLLAWRLDVAHVDPLSLVSRISGGSPKFPRGVPVLLRAVSGHRDVNFTDCPGNALYAELPQIASAAAALGGPKIYAPVVSHPGESQVRFTARLSVAQPWTVAILSSAGAQVAQGTGTGTTVDWTWDSSLAPTDRYRWAIATADARSATGALGAVVALAVQKAAVSPTAVAPGETTTVSYTLTAAASVVATLVAPGGQAVSTLLTAEKPAGVQTLTFIPPPGLPNGPYAVVVSATAGPKTATATVPLAIDDILTGFTSTLSHSTATVEFTLARAPLQVVFEVRRGTQVVAAPPLAPLLAGPQLLTWDGTLADRTRAPDGPYTLAIGVTDDIGSFTRTASVTLDTTAPRITVLSNRGLRFRVSEPATLTLVVGARRFTRTLMKPATTQFWLKAKPTAYTLTATDAAGNSSSVRYRR